MKTIEWDGKRIQLHDDPDDWSVDEIDAVEEGLGCSMALMRGGRTTAAGIAISVHRSDPSWDIAVNIRDIKPIKVMRTGENTSRAQRRAKVVTRPDADPLVSEPGGGGDDAAPPEDRHLSPGNAGASVSSARAARKAPADRKPAAKATARRTRGSAAS